MAGQSSAGEPLVLPNLTYGFIGIGAMGLPMAQQLRAKIPKCSLLVICEIVEARIKKFLDETEGEWPTEVAESPREVAQKADIIITMVPRGPHVKDVFLNPKTGLLSIGPISRSILFMECSTIDTVTSLEVNKAVTAAGHRFVDAPVSGGVNGAYGGSLTFMIGGSPQLFNESKVFARAMGKEENIYHCGGPGAGLATKQINNYLSAICILGTSEAFNMGRLYGLDPKVLASVINVSTGMNYNSSAQNPVKGVTSTAAAAKDFEGGFSIELCKNVVELAVDLGKQVGARSLLSDVVVDSLEKASQDERCKGKDCRSIYRWVADV